MLRLQGFLRRADRVVSGWTIAALVMDSFSRTTAAETYSSISRRSNAAGLSSLNEGQRVEYEVVSNRGKESADNLKAR